MGMMRSKDDIEERMKGNGEMLDIKNLLDLIEEGLGKMDRDKEWKDQENKERKERLSK